MKRIFKRTISMILVSSMLTSMMFFSNLVVFAAGSDDQGSVGKCEYSMDNSATKKEELVQTVWDKYVSVVEDAEFIGGTVEQEAKTVDIKLLGDWTIGDTIKNALTVPKGKTVNLDMNGYMIKMPRSSSNSATNHLDFIFKVEDEATFNITSENNNELERKGFIYKKDKDNDPNDGLWFDGESMAFVKKPDPSPVKGAIISGYGCTSCMQIGKKAKVNIKNVSIMGMGDRSTSSTTDYGAIYIEGSESTLSVENSKIMYNASKKNGGGIYVGAKAELSNVNISSSKAQNGGGIYINKTASDTKITGGKIKECKATESGGGIYINKEATNTRITNATIIEKCTATKSGGGIYVGAQAELETVAIDSSKAKNGGGIYVGAAASDTKITNGTITQCTDAESGGGIYVGVKAELSNVNIFSSNAQNGGGIYVDKEASDTKITGGKINECEATDGGGGIYVGAKAELENVAIDSSKSKNGGGIYVGAAASDTKITGGKTMQCEATDGGGGIYVGKKAELENVAIDSSKAKNGGGIYVDKEASNTKITGDTIRKCEAAESGGGIYVNKNSGKDTSRKLSIINCNIEKNRANKCGFLAKTDERIEYGGGGIYIVGESKDNRLNTIKIKDTTITGNMSNGNGGGAYLGFINDITFDKCTIQRNCALNGGGIYNNAYTNISIADTDIRDNTALRSNGGGVYVENECNVKLSGSVKIYNNISKKTKEGNIQDIENNLNFERAGKSATYGVGNYAYINGDAIIQGTSGGSSAVGITCENYRVISKPGMHMINKFEERAGEKKKIGFYADQVNGGENKKRHLEWQNTDRKRGDYRCIRMAEGDLNAGASSTIKIDSIKKDDNNVKTVNNEKCNAQDIIKGYFSFSSNNEKKDISSVFYYSDGFFNDDPKNYNTQLATMSMNMAMAAFNSNVWESSDEKDPNRYKNKDRNIKKLFTDISCKDIFTSETYQKKPEKNSIAVAIAHKTITLNDKKSYELIPIAIRGSGYESEWASNFTVGPASNGEAEGFASAADQVIEHLDKYINDYALKNAIDNGTVKFWVVGYSRAGATANLTSKRLVDKYVVGREADKKNQVYGYCMENPQGGYVSATNIRVSKGLFSFDNIAEYDCIHNCINKTDLVPLVAPALIGFTRYGVDHYVPGDAGATQQPTRQIDEIKDSSEKLPEKYYALERSARDNTAWDVLSEDGLYNDQRTKMLKQLNSVNRFIAFDDSFEAYNIPLSSTFSDNKSPFGKILDGIGAVLDANYVKQDEEVKDTRTVFKGSFNNQDKFLRAFVYNLFNWGLDAKEFKKENLRDRYAIENPKNNEDDKEYSVQGALSGILNLIHNKNGEQFSLIKKFLGEQMGNAGIADFTVLVSAVYCNDYKKFSQKIIDIIKINNISDVALTEDEKKNIENYVQTLIVFLLNYVKKDINNSKLGYLATFYKNSDRLLQSHVPEVNLAWLRSYDDYYTHEADLAVELEA